MISISFYCNRETESSWNALEHLEYSGTRTFVNGLKQVVQKEVDLEDEFKFFHSLMFMEYYLGEVFKVHFSI